MPVPGEFFLTFGSNHDSKIIFKPFFLQWKTDLAPPSDKLYLYNWLSDKYGFLVIFLLSDGFKKLFD